MRRTPDPGSNPRLGTTIRDREVGSRCRIGPELGTTMLDRGADSRHGIRPGLKKHEADSRRGIRPPDLDPRCRTVRWTPDAELDPDSEPRRRTARRTAGAESDPWTRNHETGPRGGLQARNPPRTRIPDQDPRPGPALPEMPSEAPAPARRTQSSPRCAGGHPSRAAWSDRARSAGGGPEERRLGSSARGWRGREDGGQRRGCGREDSPANTSAPPRAQRRLSGGATVCRKPTAAPGPRLTWQLPGR